ncbi:hypothetical protein KJ742_00055 [Patescibacteria group bacterium]|nr:hypothetical protein [Patescibacteria group bacterium]MBU1932188.1 hypothetical protein [Patescibacteria group bacterium]
MKDLNKNEDPINKIENGKTSIYFFIAHLREFYKKGYVIPEKESISDEMIYDYVSKKRLIINRDENLVNNNIPEYITSDKISNF